eukprot:1160603-Pelagomonas_calceolata.AAC.9
MERLKLYAPRLVLEEHHHHHEVLHLAHKAHHHLHIAPIKQQLPKKLHAHAEMRQHERVDQLNCRKALIS